MRSLYLFLLLMVGFIGFQCSTEVHPPVAKKIAKTDTLFGDVRTDYYYWMRERTNPEVIDYLEAENEYAQFVMKDTRTLQESLFEEMKSHIKETDVSVPVKFGEYYYYSRTEEGKQYPIFCRKKGSLEANEEIYLDQNKLAEGKSYFRIGTLAFSKDHKFLAFIADTTGREQFVLYIKNLNTGEFLKDKVADLYYGIVWGNDNQTIFYVTLDSTLRPYRVYRHIIGEEQGNDQLIYQENDGKFYVSLRKSRSGQYIFMNLNSQVTSEVWFLNADKPYSKFNLMKPREYQVEYSVEHQGKYFYITTNKDAVNFKVMRTKTNQPQEKYWKTYIQHSPQTTIYGVEAFRDFLVISLRENALRTLRIIDLQKKKEFNIPADEEVYSIYLENNPEYTSETVRYTYNSMITPKSIYDFNVKSGEKTLLKQVEVPGYNPDLYESGRLWASSRDGKKIPLSIIYKKGLEKNGQNPCLLYGYGSYGATIDPNFSSNRLALLDRGFIYVIAHIRGGGAMGRTWYLDGKLLKKKNTFNDFIDAAEYLIAEQYTNPEKLAILGGSAGGLLMGAVTNMRPDLFKAVVAKVPFVDVVNTMLDPTIPLTVIEYDEWGNPQVEEFYHYIKSYSPYDNVVAKNYPHILVTAGLYDPRVQYWEPAKWVAKLRAHKTDTNMLLLKTNMEAGHFSHSGRYDYLKDVAFDYAFILKALGIQK
ncbi:MAG: oligopeptidase B [Calditrichia bacterium]